LPVLCENWLLYRFRDNGISVICNTI
jgi:hypothetical protein